MEGRKKIAVSAIGLLMILLGSVVASGLFSGESAPTSPQDQIKPSAPPNPIPGWVFTGLYIRIGVNKGGTFGVGQANPGTGFQFPIGPQFESLAIWWWGEGYAVFYKNYTGGRWVDYRAYWWPDLGWPPPAACNLVPVSASVTRDDDNEAIVKVSMKTRDGILKLEFIFNFPKHQKYVWLQTKITSNFAVRDVLYKRIVDWDIHHVIVNDWTSDSHSAYASYYNKTLERTIELSVSGYTAPVATEGNLPTYVDLDVWGEVTPPNPYRDPGIRDIQSHNNKLTFDGNAAIYYDIGNLAAGKNRIVYTVYQAGWNWLTPG